MIDKDEALDNLAVLSDILQVINTSLLLRTTSNDDILSEVKKINQRLDNIEKKLNLLTERVNNG